MQDDLKEATVAAQLDTSWIGRSYQYMESVGSTNETLKQQLALGGINTPPSGAVVLAEFQERGRGRFNRSWQAPPHTSLLLSVLFRPNWQARHLSWLTMIAGLAVAEAIEKATSIPAFLKWPNDVVIRQGDTWAKVSGILLEGSITPEQRLANAVLGTGINVNIRAADLPSAHQPATSLMIVAGKPVARLPLLVALLQRLESWYEAAEKNRSPHTPWNQRLITLNQRVVVKRMGEDSELLGTAEGTDELGQLLVRDDQGRLHAVMAADVTLRRAT